MNKVKLRIILLIILTGLLAGCRKSSEVALEELFRDPPEESKPWVYWYWMNAAVSEEGITADLEAMKENGIRGAYLFFVQGPADPPLYSPAAEQLTPVWWDRVAFAFDEAKRLNLKLALHSCDGFTVAGGPWISPEKSMQKIVWSEINVSGNQTLQLTLPKPETVANYYRDLVVYAYPTPVDKRYHTDRIAPHITTSKGDENISFLSDPDNEDVFKSNEPCWIQYRFDEPFTCRSIHIRTGGLNYASHHLIIESSDDGISFSRIGRLEPPRHGWQDYEMGISHAIPKTTAKYFRFIYSPENTEPGAEDMETAKWNPALKIRGITLSGMPVIHQYEGKNGSIWRVGRKTTSDQVTPSDCIPSVKLLDITANLDTTGRLRWKVPAGDWTILRIGHTSTGHTNYKGGGGKGLECDKFDPEVVKFQFDEWFGKIYQHTPSAPEVIKIFHIDSWECGSQNWSGVFPGEFKKRRGYDLYPYLPVLTGLPVESINISEGVLYDIRLTIAELLDENFFSTMKALAHAKGIEFSAECTAPVMPADGMSHFRYTDIPMGEFWFNSPTHDKPNDILDAVSGAHIYGRKVVQAESFTTLRMDWSEHPALLKPLADYYFTQGINRLAIHVFTHNPWTDRKPGMTLNGVGLYFQRDQTWWDVSKDWIRYLHRCQTMLQQGDPVTDIAVFTGEEIPRRALTPDRLIGVLPGLFDEARLSEENTRLENRGVPMEEGPKGVNHTKNIFSLKNWNDPLNGYAYDCINRDALLRLAKVENGRIVLPGGASYGVLVIPGTRKMDPEFQMSTQVAEKILSLINDGATVLFNGIPVSSPGKIKADYGEQELREILSVLHEGEYYSLDNSDTAIEVKKYGKGSVIKGPYQANSLESLGIKRDFIIAENSADLWNTLSWTHRKGKSFDLYFLSNQSPRPLEFTASVRATGKQVELFDPLTARVNPVRGWEDHSGRTSIPVKMVPYGSVFLVITARPGKSHENEKVYYGEPAIFQFLEGPWKVTFDPARGGTADTVEFPVLSDWSESDNDRIKFYSGTAIYLKTFNFEEQTTGKGIWLNLGSVENIAEIFLNGTSCGTLWTYPYRVEITDCLQQGSNELIIRVTNTWHNRLIGDHELRPEERITWTNAPFRLQGDPLKNAGLLGPVGIEIEN